MRRAHNLAVEDRPDGSPILALARAFEAEGVAWCCLRGAGRIPLALAGHSDLDVLIARADRPRAARIFADLGFKHFPDATLRSDPAMQSFFAYEETSGRLLHVHAHFRLAFGPSLTKGVRVPIEDKLLKRSVLHADYGLRLPDPVDEALLLVLRRVLDVRASDPVAFVNRRSLDGKFAREFERLSERVTPDALRSRAAEAFEPGLSADIAALYAQRGGGAIARMQARARIERAVSIAASSGWTGLRLRSLVRTVAFLAGALDRRYLQQRAARRVAPGGGLVITLAGVDGSGKSTQSRQLREWLGAELDVMPCYFGTGDGRPSLLLAPFKALVPLVQRLVRVKPKGASHGQVSDRPPGLAYSALFTIWAFAVALDKKRKLNATGRATARGMIVITDRYPQNEIERFNDGPLLSRIPRAPTWLRRMEARVYRQAQLRPPDLVLKLHVGHETVARREPEMVGALIDARIAWLGQLSFGGAKTISIDGRAPLEQVTAQVRRAVWDML